MRIRIGAAAVLVVVLCASPAAFAGLYGLSSWTAGPPTSSVLYTVNSTTGVATPVVTVSGAVSLTGLSFLEDTLYATDALDVASYNFGWINLSSGVFTVLVDQLSVNWNGLASDNCAGLLYTIDQTGTAAGNVLKSITPAGGITTIATSMTIDGRGMAFRDATDGATPTPGILYATGYDTLLGTSLYTIDLTPGSTLGTSTLIGGMGLGLVSRIGLAYDEFTGTLYANDGKVGGELYTLNVATGAAMSVGVNGTPAGVWGIDGLAWLLEEGGGAPPIPLPGALLLGMIGAGLTGLLRRWKDE